jgi:hypothetical protein
MIMMQDIAGVSTNDLSRHSLVSFLLTCRELVFTQAANHLHSKSSKLVRNHGANLQLVMLRDHSPLDAPAFI